MYTTLISKRKYSLFQCQTSKSELNSADSLHDVSSRTQILEDDEKFCSTFMLLHAFGVGAPVSIIVDFV